MAFAICGAWGAFIAIPDPVLSGMLIQRMSTALIRPHHPDNAFLVKTNFGKQKCLVAMIDEMIGKSHAHKPRRTDNFVEDSCDLRTLSLIHI